MKDWMIWHFKIAPMMVHYATLGDALSVTFLAFVKTSIKNLFIKQLRRRKPAVKMP